MNESFAERKSWLIRWWRAQFGHSTQLHVFVIPDLFQRDEVRAAAGTWNDNFGANPNDIARVAGGVVTDLKQG